MTWGIDVDRDDPWRGGGTISAHVVQICYRQLQCTCGAVLLQAAPTRQIKKEAISYQIVCPSWGSGGREPPRGTKQPPLGDQ